MLKKIYQKMKLKKEKAFMNDVTSFIDFDLVENVKPAKVKIITFVIPQMRAYSGGHTSILRLGTQLYDLGYEINYVSHIEQEKDDMIKNAKINLASYKGDLFPKSELNKLNSDIVVATSWESAFFVKKMNGYKMYFVQDYEPYFHFFGEVFLIAKKTYELGLHMVSLGKWNKYMIEKNCEIHSDIDVIDFPYEKKEYSKFERDYKSYKNKTDFTFAVYIKNVGKRAPYIIQNILENVKNEFKKDNINLEIKYYGEDQNFQCSAGENLGRLTKAQLFELYKEADFGMCASLTNISLVPYEMLATGLPLIEFEDGTYKYFLPEDSAILISFNWRDLYEELKNSINNPDLIEKRVKSAYFSLENLSWENSTKQFCTILNEITDNK
ncbi:glycosyltransferase family 1 protein [Clostridium intestinale]|uniref:glycosyltransferase family 1 protein n=1 Tax=Clostridium intestinale TaxID=36845 RepID=UPI0028EE2951|nr:glycosyltransferase family 1 protein [Clostridium intestinale]